jgi:hypothetical protein
MVLVLYVSTSAMELRKRGSCEDICAGKHSACFRACIGIEACEPCRQAMAACVHACPSRKRNLKGAFEDSLYFDH